MKPLPRLFSLIPGSCLFATLLPATALAQSGEAVTDQDLLLSANPIIIKSRLRMANEYSNLSDGGSRDKLVLGAVYGFGFNGRDQDYGIGFELPYLFNPPNDGGNSSGYGDFKLRCGHLFTDDPKGWRSGLFFETEFDTSANAVRSIANQRTQMTFGGGAGYAILDNFVLTSTLQYGWSLDDGETTGRKAEWEAHLTATWKVSGNVAVNLDYKAAVNTVGGTELFNTLEPSVGWSIGADKHIGLFASCEIPLDDTGTDWVAKAGMIWFF